jgi:hypothetical protein
MAPDKESKTPQEFEVAYYTKELGRSMQRKMLQKRLDDFCDSGALARHGEEPGMVAALQPPPEDRAG